MSRTPERVADVAEVDCSGTTALVTGSTSGIGRAAALALGRLGADVVVHGRDEAAGEAVVDELRGFGVDATFRAADFADVDAVREFAADVAAWSEGIDVLVNNAGGYFRSAERTDLGVEYTFQVNHLAPYLLTAELLDVLEPGARVVTTASAAHRGATLDVERARSVESYSATWAYSHSKLANVLFASELDRRLSRAGREVSSNSFHPGAIPGSDFSRFLPGPLQRVVGAFDALPLITSVEDGAAAILKLAVSPRLADVSGRYFSGLDPKTPTEAARDPVDARRLWRESARILDVEEPLADDEDAVDADEPVEDATGGGAGDDSTGGEATGR